VNYILNLCARTNSHSAIIIFKTTATVYSCCPIYDVSVSAPQVYTAASDVIFLYNGAGKWCIEHCQWVLHIVSGCCTNGTCNLLAMSNTELAVSSYMHVVDKTNHIVSKCEHYL